MGAMMPISGDTKTMTDILNHITSITEEIKIQAFVTGNIALVAFLYSRIM